MRALQEPPLTGTSAVSMEWNTPYGCVGGAGGMGMTTVILLGIGAASVLYVGGGMAYQRQQVRRPID